MERVWGEYGFYNVLRGDMSFVGPRPERSIFVEQFKREVAGYNERSKVKPGLTGLAQINGFYHTSAQTKLKYDLAYVYNHSLWLDIRRPSMNALERENTDLIKEFNRYIREHPGYADNIPNNAIVIMQLEGDEEFNEWSLKLAKSHAEKGQPLVYVRIKKIKPIRSRIEELELKQQVAY